MIESVPSPLSPERRTMARSGNDAILRQKLFARRLPYIILPLVMVMIMIGGAAVRHIYRGMQQNLAIQQEIVRESLTGTSK